MRALLLLALLAPHAFADTRVYNAQVGAQTYVVTVNVSDADGVPSVSLRDVVRQLGGQIRVEDGNVGITLLGASANFVLGDTRIASSHNEFTIQRAPTVVDNDILIAVDDLAPFFSYGFKLDLKEGAPTQPTAAPVAASEPLPPPTPGRTVVVLDPGHGGNDAGEDGPSGVQEKTITLAVAQQVAKLLGASCDVALTRAEDVTLSSFERVSDANGKHRGSLLVSLHTGASDSATPGGIEIFCPLAADEPSAHVQRSLALGRSIANSLSQSTGTVVRGVRQAPCRMFAGLQMPGALVEMGFITNPSEEPLLTNPDYQTKLAQGIANGILAYISGKTP